MTHENQKSGMSPSGPPTDWEALARRVTGESSPEESARIDAWLAGHPEQREILATLDNAMSRMADEIQSDIDVEGALKQVKARRDAIGKAPLELRPARKPQPRPVWRVAVPALAASGLLAIGVLTFRSSKESAAPSVASAVQPRLLATGVGVRDSLTLPDGSRVILGPMSSIRISSRYEEGVREVEVAGDAWFDVAKRDGMKQFTVRAGSATIVDIGTRFAVQSDAADGVSVTVTEGSVSVAAANQPAAETVFLKAGDNALLQKDGTIRTRRGTATEDDLAWMSGRLVFRETPMTEVASAIHRWYGIDLRMDSSLQSRRITATFTSETPDAMLDVLRLVLDADIQRRGDTAVVTSGGRSLR